MAEKIRINKKYDLDGSYNPSDSEDDFTPREKNLLEKVKRRKDNDSASEEEMYAFSESDSDDGKEFTMADSDVEGKDDSEDDLPDAKAWGKSKRSYYSTDYVDQDYGGFGEHEEEGALLEEQEAKNIQQRLMQQLGDEDFSLDFFTNKQTDKKEETDVVIKSDLTQMSKRQKLQLLEKESPEFLGLIDDFKTKLTVAKDDMKPVLNLVKNGKLPECPASNFIKTNYDLILNYCTNISFYLLLKAKRISIQNHPVVKRLYQYRQMLKQMEPIYEEVIKPQIEAIMAAINDNVNLVFRTEKANKKRKSERSMSTSGSKKLKLLNTFETDDKDDTGVSDNEDEYDGEDYFTTKTGLDSKLNNQDESEESGFSDNNVEAEDDDEGAEQSSAAVDIPLDEEAGEKREITYQIAKNKGLTPHRKKEQRNPRVKHRMKYKKAKVRRKGAVREVRTELSRYGGEASGIKANVKKSIKIK